MKELLEEAGEGGGVGWRLVGVGVGGGWNERGTQILRYDECYTAPAVRSSKWPSPRLGGSSPRGTQPLRCRDRRKKGDHLTGNTISRH